MGFSSVLCRSRLSLVIFVVGGFGAAASADDNTPPEGFRALFNGKDLAGWKGLVKDPPARAKMSKDELATAQTEADSSMLQHWSVKDGVLSFDGKGDNLCTVEDYGDFELLVDWKVPPGGDSGIYVRGSPQVQIWDNPEGSGGLYNNQKNPRVPLIVADKKPGEWNQFRIIMIGPRITAYLNDMLVVDDTVLENYWERGKPIYPTGAIELQNHGGPLFFKNIYVRRLEGTKARPDLVLKKGDTVAVVGDSITEQRLYSRYIEDYLVACLPELELRVFQLGWSGEWAPQFAARMDNDLIPLEPNVVTFCYGMNDGAYKPWEPATGANYGAAMSGIVKRLDAAGVRSVIGSPGAVDFDTFKGLDPKVYNGVLAHFRDIDRELARTTGNAFANVHDAMILAQMKAKPVLGNTYPVCGSDGFHPGPNGHLVMAYAFLKSLGTDGAIGTISFDGASGKAEATAGHSVLSSSASAIEIESARYPFCFTGDAKSAAGTRSILPFVPFNQHLNRFVLVVKNLQAPKAKVTWGSESKSFTKEQLDAGVNLAAEFEKTPFDEAFAAVDKAVVAKQEFQTHMIKSVITKFRGAPDAADAAERAHTRRELMRRDDELHRAVLGARKPVKHRVTIEAQP